MERTETVKHLLLPIVALSSLAGFAETLTWTGASSTVWDKTTANWKTTSGAAVTYSDGADVTVSDATGTTAMTLGAKVTPGSVEFSVADSLALGFSADQMYFSGSGPFVKTGAGTLTLNVTGGSQAFRGLTGDVTVRDGTLVCRGANMFGSFSGVSATAKTFTIEDGATLQVPTRNTFGKVDSLAGSFGKVHVKKGGTFQLGPDGTLHTGNTVNDLCLDGGSVVFSGNGVSTFQGTLTVLGTLSVTGDVAQVIDDQSTTKNNRLGLRWQYDGSAKKTESSLRTCFDVADVTGDAAADLTVKYPLVRGHNKDNVAGFVKTGLGRMRLEGDTAESRVGANGDISVMAGVLELAGPMTIPTPLVKQNIYIGTNATLHVSHVNALDAANTLSVDHPWPRTCCHVDHGTLLFDCTNAVAHFHLPDQLVLENAVVSNAVEGVADQDYALGSLSLGSLLHFTGTEPMTLAPAPGKSKNTRLALLFEGEGTEIRVDDVTGDDGVDATITHKLCDYRYQITGKSSTRKGGLVKTGVGTLLLSPSTTALNTFNGDVAIREGTVRLDKTDYSWAWFGKNNTTFLGNMKDRTLNTNRVVTVYTNGVLELGQRNLFCSYTYGADGGNQITTPFVLKGGMLRFVGSNAANPFGDMVVDGGHIAYDWNNSGWGVFNFRGVFKVTGDTVLELPTCKNPILPLYPNHASVFEIDDVTQDGRSDFITFLSPCKPPDATLFNGTHTNADKTVCSYTYGFVKRGAGTMELAGKAIASWNFDDEARVEAGTLLVDGDFTNGGRDGGAFVVSAGALVGGTGTVARVTLAEGAGLSAQAGQAEGLKVWNDVTLPATGVIRLVGAGTAPRIRARVLEMKPGQTLFGGANLSRWTVEAEGVTEPGRTFCAFQSANAVYVTEQVGTIVIFR